MKKIIDITSKKVYEAPIIKFEELEKRDILMLSVTVTSLDNQSFDAVSLPNDVPDDLFDEIFGSII